MGSFYIPTVVMILLYWRIFAAIRQRAKRAAALHDRNKKPNGMFMNDERFYFTLFVDDSDTALGLPKSDKFLLNTSCLSKNRNILNTGGKNNDSRNRNLGWQWH
jgi:hypothetical protein